MKKRVMIVAEISANHGHDIDVVKRTMLKAKEIGCDAVKIQTYRPDTITLDCDNEYFQINNGTIWDGTTLYSLYNEAFLPWEWHEELFDFAKKNDILLFSTPFDNTAIDLLEKCNNPIYKIASFEITDIPLIEQAASKQKPMIISTGIAMEDEIKEAVAACRRNGNEDITLLKCTSQYPAKIADANLLTMTDMKRRFGCKVGVSDHTEGDIVPVTAVALGAEVIEKHFILDREIGGPDASFSMEPYGFKLMIDRVRAAEEAIGVIDYSLSEGKKNSRRYARSLFISEDVKKGDSITADNVKSVRPSDGMSPKYYRNVLGQKFATDAKYGTPLTDELIEWSEKTDEH
ncbi:MAG: pseudaminic acid synthase [Lentihominibacter sp.]